MKILFFNNEYIFHSASFCLLNCILTFTTFNNSQPEPSCYELLEDYESVRDNAKFWFEGVGILVFGSFGFVGNVLSIVVFRRSRGNEGFNTLLIM